MTKREKGPSSKDETRSPNQARNTENDGFELRASTFNHHSCFELRLVGGLTWRW